MTANEKMVYVGGLQGSQSSILSFERVGDGVAFVKQFEIEGRVTSLAAGDEFVAIGRESGDNIGLFNPATGNSTFSGPSTSDATHLIAKGFIFFGLALLI